MAMVPQKALGLFSYLCPLLWYGYGLIFALIQTIELFDMSKHAHVLYVLQSYLEKLCVVAKTHTFTSMYFKGNWETLQAFKVSFWSKRPPHTVIHRPRL